MGRWERGEGFTDGVRAGQAWRQLGAHGELADYGVPWERIALVWLSWLLPGRGEAVEGVGGLQIERVRCGGIEV